MNTDARDEDEVTQLKWRVRNLEEALLKLVMALREDRAGEIDWTERVPAIIRLLEDE